MNMRIMQWVVMACFSAVAGSAGAVALGEMRALSALGEPLKLQLTLTDLAAVNPADVRVILAPGEDYTRLGLIPPVGAEQWQVSMQGDPVRGGRGVSALITSSAAPQDPNISFLVQLIWPGNLRVQQVTTVLLPAVVVDPDPALITPSLPEVAPATEVIPVGTAVVSVSPSSAGTPEAIEQIPAAQPAAQVKPGDTLSRLARNWYLPRASWQQRQQLLAQGNPQLFINGNINLLKAGAIIRYPAARDLAMPSAEEASAWLAAHRSGRVPVMDPSLDEPALTKPALSAQTEAGTTATDQEVTLTLVSPDASSGSAQVAGETAAEAEPGSLAAEQNALLAQRTALQAELAALERNRQEQDLRMQVLDARLASLNSTSTTPAGTQPVTSDSAWRTSWVVAAAGFFLALLVVLRRRAAAISAAADADRQRIAAAPESDYAAFEPLEPLPVPDWSRPSMTVSLPEPALASSDPDEEYDFLSDAESAALQTRLDLAQAYIDMQESELARELLNAVLARGNPLQRQQATTLLSSLA